MFVSPQKLINFKFKLTPENAQVEFPAYLKAISANFNSNWNTYDEVGRADPKVLYASFSKTLSIDFFAVAEHESGDAAAIFDKLELLAKSVVPKYSGAGFQGNFVIFTLGNMYVNQVGYVTSLTYNWDNTQITWDIEAQLPHITDVSMTINWVGRKMPESSIHRFFDHK